MKLAMFLSPQGEHLGAWRHPAIDPSHGSDFDHYLGIVRAAEAAFLDMILVADVSHSSDDPLATLSRMWIERLDPTMLLSALAVTTRHIGLTGTLSTTYNQPYHVARRIASLDHLSKGRAGWNVVTTMNVTDAWNFGDTAHAPHADRYRRAEEFVDVVFGLWDTWEDDAFVRDQASGLYFRPDARHMLHHKGEHFAVRGPLDVARPPQGRPVIIQAGSSDRGQQLSSRVADVVFTLQRQLEGAQTFYRAVKQQAAGFGRNPDAVSIVLGMMPIVGRTRAEAQAKQRELDEILHPAVAIAQLSKILGDIDLTRYDMDQPLPDDLPLGNGITSRRAAAIELGKRDNLTIRQLGMRLAGARGHWTVVGTAADIADAMQERFENAGCDGYLLVLPTLPGGIRDFGDLVTPELQRRGLMRTGYTEGETLRDMLGLPRPPHPAAARSAAAQ